MNGNPIPPRDLLAAAIESQPPVDDAVLAASRAGALGALRAAPRARAWTRQATAITAFGLGATIAGALVTAAIAGHAGRLFDARLPVIALLLATQALALWAALRPGPGRWWGNGVSWTAAALGAGALLAGRTATGSGLALSDAGGWICSVSHLAVELAPAVVVLAALRRISWSLRRALTAGLAVGVSGLVWGEIACQRSWSHVVVHHFGALGLMVLACVLMSRRLARGAVSP
jgi:hypothetical protein